MSDTRQAEREQQVAQLWCLPQHSHKEMDVEFAQSIVALLKTTEAAVLEEAAKTLDGTAAMCEGANHPIEKVDAYRAAANWLRDKAQERRV